MREPQLQNDQKDSRPIRLTAEDEYDIQRDNERGAGPWWLCCTTILGGILFMLAFIWVAVWLDSHSDTISAWLIRLVSH